ncbi:MAG TPA: VanW family protein, partial [Polyangiales bacterium]|nr:VanW family protein [Polyangiales bacterium]
MGFPPNLRLALLAGTLLVSLSPDPAAHAAAPLRVEVAGQRVELGTDPRQAAQRVAREYLSGELLVRAGSLEQRVTRESLGARIDVDHLAALLHDAGDARSALRRVHAQTLGRRALQLPMPCDLDPAAATTLLMQLKDSSDAPATEPRIDPRARRVTPARPGAELDVYASLERIDGALRRGDKSVQAVIHSVAANRSTRALTDLELPAVLGDFETRYTDDRAQDLKLTAARLDGFVLAPGAVFDWNAVLGDRTDPNAPRPASAVRDGGAAQIASTLHAAVFFAGLPILTRVPQPRPSYAIKLGLDAAVALGTHNFRFSNDRPYPLVLGVTAGDGRVYASVHGRSRDRSVIFIRHIDSAIPFEERTSVDAKLPSGMRVLDQRGIPGFKVTRVRIIRDPVGRQDVRERTTDSYAPTPQLWRVGIGGEPRPGFERPRNDPRP